MQTESILKPVDKDVDTTQGVEVGGESSSHLFPRAQPMQFCVWGSKQCRSKLLMTTRHV